MKEVCTVRAYALVQYGSFFPLRRRHLSLFALKRGRLVDQKREGKEGVEVGRLVSLVAAAFVCSAHM